MATNQAQGLGAAGAWKRVYPQGQTAAHVLGLLIDGRGADGVELTHEQELAAGRNVRLTLNSRAQTLAEQVLGEAAKNYAPQWAYALVVQPQSGSVLAWAQYPFIQPNDRSKYIAATWTSRIQTMGLEPGGLIKPLTVAMALESVAVTLDTPLDGGNGFWRYKGNIVLRDAVPFRSATVRDGLAASSHILLAQVGLRLGAERLYRGLLSFGFGSKTGIDLPGEIPGYVRHPSRWSAAEITRIPLGYAIFVTPLQLTRAYCILANGGLMPPPLHVADPAAASQTIASLPGTLRVLRQESVTEVVEVLKTVFARNAPRESMGNSLKEFAGFGATTQKAGPSGYEPGKFTSAFCAFKSNLVILVVLDEPTPYLHPSTGGAVAESIAVDLARELVSPP